MARQVGAMTKADVIRQLALATGLDPTVVRLLFEAQAQLAYKEARNGFLIPGIGKLVVITSPPRKMIIQFGPKAGQTITVPARRRLKFRVSAEAKRRITGQRLSVAAIQNRKEVRKTMQTDQTDPQWRSRAATERGTGVLISQMTQGGAIALVRSLIENISYDECVARGSDRAIAFKWVAHSVESAEVLRRTTCIKERCVDTCVRPGCVCVNGYCQG